MSEKIELRLSNIDPPTPEPKRTIYRDIVNLPDPVKLGITIRYFNYDDVGLYFQITGSGTGYTFGTVNLGLLASGANTYKNLDEFASRAKPSAEVTESITLTLKAYTDSGYTNLKWTYDRVVTVAFINSADPSYTVDVLNNFDDGTVQGWLLGLGSYYDGTLAVATDYVLSAPYSLKRRGVYGGTLSGCTVAGIEIHKEFTTPNKDTIYAIMDLRFTTVRYGRTIEIYRDTTLIVQLGGPRTCANEHLVPLNKWVRIITPLPKNTTLTLKIWLYDAITADYGWPEASMWLDDFKIISK